LTFEQLGTSVLSSGYSRLRTSQLIKALQAAAAHAVPLLLVLLPSCMQIRRCTCLAFVLLQCRHHAVAQVAVA
jgi:hypothetical protein